MVYKWKTNWQTGGVNPNDAGKLFKELESKNSLNADTLVEISRPEDALLHKCFEWDDNKAAELYRKQQANQIISNLTVVIEDKEPVRAFLNIKTIGSNYESLENIYKSEIKVISLLGQAKQDMEIFKTKYSALEELKQVFAEMDNVLNDKKGA